MGTDLLVARDAGSIVEVCEALESSERAEVYFRSTGIRRVAVVLAERGARLVVGAVV